MLNRRLCLQGFGTEFRHRPQRLDLEGLLRFLGVEGHRNHSEEQNNAPEHDGKI